MAGGHRSGEGDERLLRRRAGWRPAAAVEVGRESGSHRSMSRTALGSLVSAEKLLGGGEALAAACAKGVVGGWAALGKLWRRGG